jgi:hypothetical protein
MLTIALASAASLTIGVCGRLSALVLLLSHQAVTGINPAATGCDDQLIGNALWLLVLARSTATLSLACRLRTGVWTSDELVPAWPRWLAIFQLIVVYFTAGIQKTGITWFPFGDWSALYYILQDPAWQRFDMSWLAWIYPLTQVGTATTWLWEVSAPLLGLALWAGHRRASDDSRRGWLLAFGSWLHRWNFRRYYVLTGIAMHLGIWLFMSLGNFTWISCSYYFCLYAPREWHTASDRSAPSEPAGNSILVRWIVPLFVLWHVLAVSLGSLPGGVPSGDDGNRAETERWAALLNAWHVEVSTDDLEARVRQVGQTSVQVRDYLIAPFQPYYKYCGVTQGWPMFSNSGTHAQRLFIEIEVDESWRTLYAQSKPEFAWRRHQFNHEHFRSAVYYALNDKAHAKSQRLLAAWIARQAAADFPRADRLRLRLEEFAIASPEEVRDERRPLGTMHVIADLPLQAAREASF